MEEYYDIRKKRRIIMSLEIFKKLRGVLNDQSSKEGFSLKPNEERSIAFIHKENDTNEKFGFGKLSSEEIDRLYQKQVQDAKYSMEIDDAYKNEKNDLYASINIYEKFVNQGYVNTSIPYDRLAINYRKLGLHDKEVLICRTAIERFTNIVDMDVIVTRFKSRLEKAIILKEKNDFKN